MLTRAFFSGFRKGFQQIGALVAQNTRGILVAVGVIWLYHGVAGFSRPAADVAVGVMLIGIGAYPYLRSKGRHG